MRALMPAFARFMRNGAMPIMSMDLTMGQRRRVVCGLNVSSLAGLKKCERTKKAVMAIDMSVASAAPQMPHPNPKRKRGASMALRSAPRMFVVMALRG